MTDNQKWQQQLISQAAEQRVSDQLDALEQIDIYVETNLLKIVQGQADGVTVSGQGLVTKEKIRVQEIKLQTDRIDINPLKAIIGQVQLNKPVNLMARVTLKEADINHALTSDFSRNLVQNFELDVKGKIINFDLEQMQIFLPDNEQIELRGKVQLKENNHSRSLGFTAMIRPRTHSHPIMLESFQCTEGEGVSLDFLVSLMQKFQYLTNLPYLQWEDMQLSLKNMQVQKETLILLVAANVNKIPDSMTDSND
ncbi:DUF2993 domain-containing protein [Anabaena sp. UHCC 0399]|uniref:LmeA family phospholipid-binding protein n=1 Tax=Anabaena sp. UHCC 0399 TaxID=3110238 RepID=UPI002B218D3E|nr:DUF2993 domain-containing protein [Anabaena sp. UHCC 0399]MEA5566769.1 DUF2993 domain-containing protein [Anabaena sp. UHCC 0399]